MTISFRSAMRARLPLAYSFMCGLLFGPGISGAVAAKPETFSLLVFSKTLGYRHASLAGGIAALRALGSEHGFLVEATEDSHAFTPRNLVRFRAVVLLSVTGDVFDPAQERAFTSYVLGGGGLAAVHESIFCPNACEENWEWLGEAMCTTFKGHSKIVPATIVIEDAHNPPLRSASAMGAHRRVV